MNDLMTAAEAAWGASKRRFRLFSAKFSQPKRCAALQWRNAPNGQVRGVTSQTIVGKDERHEQDGF